MENLLHIHQRRTDATNKIKNLNNTTSSNWKKNHHLEKQLKSHYATSPKINSLPKLHNTNIPQSTWSTEDGMTYILTITQRRIHTKNKDDMFLRIPHLQNNISQTTQETLQY